MIDHWLRLHWQLAEAEKLVLSGVRKIVGDVSFEMPGEALLNKSGLSFGDLNFSEGKGGKLSALKRIYWDQDSVDSAVEKLLSRKDSVHASASIRLQAGAKDARSSGYCMQNMTITITKTGCFVDFHYRSTEISLKFLADLLFFSKMLPPVFEKLGVQPDVIRFKFANAFISALFQPIFLRYEPNPLAFYKHLKKHDPRFYKTYLMASSKFFADSHNYTYRMRVKMFDYTKLHVPQWKIDQLMPLVAGIRGELPDDDDGEDE